METTLFNTGILTSWEAVPIYMRTYPDTLIFYWYLVEKKNARSDVYETQLKPYGTESDVLCEPINFKDLTRQDIEFLLTYDFKPETVFQLAQVVKFKQALTEFSVNSIEDENIH